MYYVCIFGGFKQFTLSTQRKNWNKQAACSIRVHFADKAVKSEFIPMTTQPNTAGEQHHHHPPHVDYQADIFSITFPRRSHVILCATCVKM